MLGLSQSERGTHKQRRFEAIVGERLGAHIPIDPIWEPQRIFPSRNKAKLSVSGSMKAPVIGLVDQSSDSVELLDCPLHRPELNVLLHALKRLIVEHKIAPYHIERRQGELKGLLLKSNEDGSGAIVRFVLRSREALSKVKKAARELLREFAFVKVVSANIQPLPAAILEGEEEILLTERAEIWERFGDTQLAFGAQSFSQVTHETAGALYEHVAGFVREREIRSMLDLFCGVGGFSVIAAPALEWGRGVELSPRAIECAKLACEKNQFANLSFESGDVETFLENYLGPKPDALLFNPPRRGVSISMIECVKKIAPRHVIYSSCNPETLLRDLGLLASHYAVLRLSPFDMFPLTEHLEVVAFLELHGSCLDP